MICQLLVDGQALAPEVAGDSLRFRLALPAGEIRLVSRAGRPAELGLSDDGRLLGVQVFALEWQQGAARHTVAPTDLAFGEGFHDAENGSFRWSNGNGLLAGGLLPPWQGEVTLHLTALPLPAAPPQPRSPHADAALMAGFESLGDDCELGFVQRNFDATPPLGLFRWSGSSYAKLLAGLENGFAGLGDPETTLLTLVEGEYRLTTPYVTMHTFHTAAADPVEDRAAVHRRGCSLLRLLRRKLLAEIAGARRFFVFKSADPGFDLPAMHRLHAALRRHGPAPLLCVALAAPGEYGGGVQRLAPGLYAGKLERFVLAEGPYAPWRQLCFRASMLHQAERP